MLPEIQVDYYRELERQALEAEEAEGMIIAIDPGTKTGCTITDGKTFKTELWNVAAKLKTKTRAAEPKNYRLLHLWHRLHEVANPYDSPQNSVIVYEGAAGFMRGKAAVEVSHKLRAVIELYAAYFGIALVMIEPNDLKQFALGKRSGGKDEMIDAAHRLGYEGISDDEADSYLIAKWAVKYRPDIGKGRE